jgi:hypothetical protein
MSFCAPSRRSLVLDANEHVTRQKPVCDLRQFRGIVFRQPFEHGAAMLFPDARKVLQEPLGYLLPR